VQMLLTARPAADPDFTARSGCATRWAVPMPSPMAFPHQGWREISWDGQRMQNKSSRLPAILPIPHNKGGPRKIPAAHTSPNNLSAVCSEKMSQNFGEAGFRGWHRHSCLCFCCCTCGRPLLSEKCSRLSAILPIPTTGGPRIFTAGHNSPNNLSAISDENMSRNSVRAAGFSRPE